MSTVSEKSNPRPETADGASADAAIASLAGNPVEIQDFVPPRFILTEEQAYKALGFAFSPLKKWAILTSVFIVQISMNFNAAIYGNAVSGMSKELGMTETQAKYGQMIFLVRIHRSQQP